MFLQNQLGKIFISELKLFVFIKKIDVVNCFKKLFPQIEKF